MTDKEKRAHDLALLYMLMEIRNDNIVPTINNPTESFTNTYKSLYNKFLTHLDCQQ